MVRSFYKLIFIFTINLIVSWPIYATIVKQSQLNFPVRIEKLIQGEIHYYFEILSPRKLVIKHPQIFDLDSLSLIQESNIKMVVTKSMTVIDKPVGFFEEQQMTDERFVSHVMGEQKVVKSNNIFKVSVPSRPTIDYKMQYFFDADDLSTLPNSKIIRAVTAAKNLDVISQGASSIMFTEKSDFSNAAKGGVSVSSYVPVKENKTLIITYNVWAVKPELKARDLENNLKNEVISVKHLIETFK